MGQGPWYLKMSSSKVQATRFQLLHIMHEELPRSKLDWTRSINPITGCALHALPFRGCDIGVLTTGVRGLGLESGCIRVGHNRAQGVVFVGHKACDHAGSRVRASYCCFDVEGGHAPPCQCSVTVHCAALGQQGPSGAQSVSAESMCVHDHY